jgi:hypothetical protein
MANGELHPILIEAARHKFIEHGHNQQRVSHYQPTAMQIQPSLRASSGSA